MSTVIGWLIFPTLGVLIWLFSGSLPFQSEVIVYNAFCPTPRVKEKCAAGEETAYPTTYKALPDQQVVVYWSAGNGRPEKYEHCAVRDAKNWTCHYDQADGERIYLYTMGDGDYTETVARGHLASNFYGVPKWNWYWIKLNQSRNGGGKP